MSTTLAKETDVLVYRDEACYSHNPSIEICPDGELLVAVQEQQRRRMRTHVDPTSRTILLRSYDHGETWDPSTKSVAVEGPGIAVNDPGLKRLADGTLIITYFTWSMGGADGVPLDNPWVSQSDGVHYAWMSGTYTVTSIDAGKSWGPPVRVPAPTGDATAVSDPVIELPDGELLIPLYVRNLGETYYVMVMRSTDRGRSWGEPTTVIKDDLNRMNFGEPSLLYLPSGKTICMHRTHLEAEQEYGYYLYQSESYDQGRTWGAVRKTPIWGHPPHLLRLASGNLLCVYGYRRPPYGVRAVLSHDEGETWDIRNELVLRNDGTDQDVGYPTSVQLADGRILTVWYLTEPDAESAESTGAFFGTASTLGYIGSTFFREVD